MITFSFGRDEHYPYACVSKGECSLNNERRPSSNNKLVHQGELALFRPSRTNLVFSMSH